MYVGRNSVRANGLGRRQSRSGLLAGRAFRTFRGEGIRRLKLHYARGEGPAPVLVEIDNGVVFVGQRDRAEAVGNLRYTGADREELHEDLQKKEEGAPRAPSYSGVYQRDIERRAPPAYPPVLTPCGFATLTVRSRPPNDCSLN